MKRYLRVVVPGLLVLSLFLVTACGPATPSTTASPVIITDQLGRTVNLNKSPQRIISLAPSNTEILYALGLADRVVAITDFDNYPPEVKGKPSIGGFATPNMERVISLSPDLVVAAPIHMDQVIPGLETKGITVLALAPRTLDEVLAAITMIGKATGTEDQAAGLVAQMQRRIKAVTDKTKDLSAGQRPKVMYLVWHDPLMASGGETFHDELIVKAGGVNAFGTVKGYPSVSLEAAVEADPAVVIAGIGMGEGMDAPLRFAQTDPRLRGVAARRNNTVYGFESDIADRAGPRIVDALEEFARLIHPELFK
jgi:iron complex transport system substrate-binding protein